MIRASLVRSAKLLIPSALAGLAFAIATAYASEEVIVTAAAPPHTQRTTEGAPGGARVDLLSVQYHVHLAGLDLTKHADVVQLEDQVKVAAQKACKSIQDQYPTRSMSDQQSCVSDATNKSMAQVKDLVAAADKGAKK